MQARRSFIMGCTCVVVKRGNTGRGCSFDRRWRICKRKFVVRGVRSMRGVRRRKSETACRAIITMT